MSPSRSSFYYFIVTGKGGGVLISIFITWEFGGRGGGGVRGSDLQAQLE